MGLAHFDGQGNGVVWIANGLHCLIACCRFNYWSLNCRYQWQIQDFSRGMWGLQLPRRVHTYLLFCKIFAESCIKMKEFGLRGRGRIPAYPLDPPLHTSDKPRITKNVTKIRTCKKIYKCELYCLQFRQSRIILFSLPVKMPQSFLFRSAFCWLTQKKWYWFSVWNFI